MLCQVGRNLRFQLIELHLKKQGIVRLNETY